MSYASLNGWWRLPMALVQEISGPNACGSDPYIAFRLDDLRVQVRGTINVARQIDSVAAQLRYLSQWLHFRDRPDFEHIDEPPDHLRSCGVQYRGCDPRCPFQRYYENRP